MWWGDLTSVQLSSRTSLGRRASIYKQWYIHISVTCFIYPAWAGLLLHKWNIIPHHVPFVFLSALCFLSCIALPVGEFVGSSPQQGAGEMERGWVKFAAISRADGDKQVWDPRLPDLQNPHWGYKLSSSFCRLEGSKLGLCVSNQLGFSNTTFPHSQSHCLCLWCSSPSHASLAVLLLLLGCLFLWNPGLGCSFRWE